MSLQVREWVDDTTAAMEDNAVFGLLFGVYYLFVGIWLTVSSRVPFGTVVYERDWDLLVVLDACRTDALASVAGEYDFLDEQSSIRSVGSTSSEWLSLTFDRAYADEIARTAYVTANPHSEEVLRRRVLPPQYVAVPFTWPDWNVVTVDDFHTLEEVWQSDYDERLGVTPPAAVTNRAIAVGRETDAERLIVHFMQPHAPYIASVVDTADPVPAAYAEPLKRLRRGDVARDAD